MLRTADLELVAIRGAECAVLIDVETSRLAIRAVREGDEEKVFELRTPKNKNGPRADRRKLNLNSALRALGMKSADVAGRYTLTCKDDSLLLVNLTELSDREKRLAAKPSRPAVATSTRK